MTETEKLIMERKSTRIFLEKKISKEIKNKILEMTLRAPTAGNMMLYSIIDVTSQELKDKLVKSCDNQPMIGKAPMVLIFCADFRKWMDFYKYSDIENYNKKNNLELYKPQEGELLIAINDALIAAQTSVIGALSLGVGSCYVGDILENFEFHKELFSLPKYVFPVTLVCYGYPTEQQIKRDITSRFPLETIVHENFYRTLDTKDFQNMETLSLKRFQGEFLEGCENLGQHFYKRKTTAQYMKERNRSVKAALKDWNE